MKKLISIVNGVEISAVFENGETYVPVKPICEAIRIDAEGQRQRIMRHYILGSVAFTLKATGADGKKAEETLAKIREERLDPNPRLPL